MADVYWDEEWGHTEWYRNRWTEHREFVMRQHEQPEVAKMNEANGGKTVLKEAFEEFHKNAREKGWWKPYEIEGSTKLRMLTADEILSKIMLIVTELAEAVEEVRKPGSDPKEVYYVGAGPEYNVSEGLAEKIPYDEWKKRRGYQAMLEMQGKEAADKTQPKPEGFGVEIADAFIRIGDLVEAMGVDIGPMIKTKHEYNRSRPIRHGGKRA